MMPLSHTPPANQSQNQTSKRAREVTWSSSLGVNPPQQDQQLAVKCPRCDSSSTKFCYYNNYSVAQPRHFCKTCRRYWTRGGALRDVPVGGGSRKTKRLKSSSSSSSSSTPSKDFPANIGRLKLPHVMSPALNSRLGGIEIPRVNSPKVLTGGIYDSELPALEGLNFPLPMVIPPNHQLPPFSSAYPPSSGEPVLMKLDGSLVSSAESLGRIDQDLHWKLQQQRLAAISGSTPQQENIANGTGSAPPAMEWFSGNSASYTLVTPSPTDIHGNENTRCNNNNSNSNSGVALIQHDQSRGARNVQQYASLLL